MLHEILATLAPGAPLRAGALTVIPLTRRQDAGVRPTTIEIEPDWLTLAEAADRVTITEVGEAGAVPTLAVTNHADRPVLLLDGEELVGAKQNRILNTTVLVAAGASITIPVSCVEQGRWAWRSRRFESSDSSLFVSARRIKAMRVSESLRHSGVHEADQGEVWDAIASKAAASGIKSPTGAMRDFYERHEADVRQGRERLAPRPGQVGAIVWIGREWTGVELLAGPRLFASAWSRLVAGYVADALDAGPEDTWQPDPDEVLQLIANAPVEPAPAVGVGAELRLGGKAVGAALVVDDRVAHLGAFPAPPEPGPRTRRKRGSVS